MDRPGKLGPSASSVSQRVNSGATHGGRLPRICVASARRDTARTPVAIGKIGKFLSERPHRGSNTGPYDLQSYALPLSYKATNLLG